MKIRRPFESVFPEKFLVLSKFISPSNEVTWRPERLFRRLEEAKRYIKEETKRIGLPSWDFSIRKLTKREGKKYREQGLA